MDQCGKFRHIGISADLRKRIGDAIFQPNNSVFDLTGTLFQLLQDRVQEFQSRDLNLLFGSTKKFFQRLLCFIKRRQAKVFANGLGEILDGCDSTTHKVRDLLNAFAKGVVLLDRFVKLDEQFSNRAGHTENAAAQAGHFPQKRTDRSQNCADRLFANIKNGE